jgi:NAD(P)-dependent dehydrogenase (short-subunit alcohol dehydrogenase family)
MRRAVGIADGITGAGGQGIPIVADMTEPQQVRRAIDQAVDQLGGIDVCVDIIGGATWSKVQDCDAQMC